MSNEAANRFAGTPDRPGHSGGGAGEQSPLQARAAFLKNRSWELVVSLNRGACSRGGAQHGVNRETQETCRREWEQKQSQVLSLDETLEFLRHCHRSAPFLFFNGNTFADIGRQISAAVFAELPHARLREVTSSIAHFIAGVLDHDSMSRVVNELSEAFAFKAGDEVQTLRGSKCGKIVRVLKDGRLVWRADSGAELTALPESLIRHTKKRK